MKRIVRWGDNFIKFVYPFILKNRFGKRGAFRAFSFIWEEIRGRDSPEDEYN